MKPNTDLAKEMYYGLNWAGQPEGHSFWSICYKLLMGDDVPLDWTWRDKYRQLAKGYNAKPIRDTLLPDSISEEGQP
jgi:hypothetical protein